MIPFEKERFSTLKGLVDLVPLFSPLALSFLLSLRLFLPIFLLSLSLQLNMR